MKTPTLLLLVLLLAFSYQSSAQGVCDTLLLTSGKLLFVQNIAFVNNQIQYEKCGNDGTVFRMNRNKLHNILYAQNMIKDYNQVVLEKDSTLMYKLRLHYKVGIRQNGYLYQFKDSSIIVAPSKTFPVSDSDLKEVDIAGLDHIYLTPKNNFRNGIKTGAITGFITGALTGLIIGTHIKEINTSSSQNSIIDNNSAPIRGTLLLGGLGALSGSIIGGIIGSFEIKVPLRGNYHRYDNKKKRFIKRWKKRQ